MVSVKEMPYSEKYKLAQENGMFLKDLAPAFLEAHLGRQAARELQEALQDQVQAVPENASFADKYEVAYGNFIRIGKCNFNFIREKMGEAGIRQFMRHEVDGLKRKNAGASVLLLNLIRAIAPGYAFVMTNKEFAYQLQWITPFDVPELNAQRAVFDIPQCKVLDYEDTEDICQIGCQGIYPMWVAEQFKVKMAFEREGKRCTCRISKLN